MSALDIFVILLLGGGAVIGFVRGFVHEVLSLFAWVVAIAMLKLFHTQLSTGLTDAVGTPAGAAVVAFALLFIPSSCWSNCSPGRSAGGPATSVARPGRSGARRWLWNDQGVLARPCSSCSPSCHRHAYGPEPSPDWLTARALFAAQCQRLRSSIGSSSGGEPGRRGAMT